MKKLLYKFHELFENDVYACVIFILLSILEMILYIIGTPLYRIIFTSILCPFNVSVIARSLYYIRKHMDRSARVKSELHSIIESLHKRVLYLHSDNKRLQMELNDIKEECIEKEGECTELRNQIERYQENISLDTIYTLYQFYLLIRKYNILDYSISIYPELRADVYCKMAVYTKMSINKEVLKNVRYHIYGTDVIL